MPTRQPLLQDTAREPVAQEPCWYVRDPAGTDGWEHGLPPSITAAQWPRHHTSGLPLVHGFTIVLHGQAHAGLSYFHPGDSESFPPDEEHATRVQVMFDGGALRGAEVGHPFWEALAAHSHLARSAPHSREAPPLRARARVARSAPHSREAPPLRARIYTDILDHQHAVVWHGLEQLRSPRCERPPLPAYIDGAAMRLDEPVAAELALRRVEQEPRVRLIQLGWPLHPVQSTVAQLRDRGFGPLVLEIEADVGGANYGDGNCQIDLERDLLDWACR